MRTALLFPGQGSQTPGMRELVEAWRPDLLARAVELVGEDPFPRVESGTAFAQPALYCASVALWERAGRPRADFLAGHSLGEIAALVAAGSIDSDDGLRLAARRGALMQAEAEAAPGGGMLAMLGNDALARGLAADHGLVVANDNAPGQLVLSGPGEALDAAAADAKDRGARSIRLPITGAFHSQAMAGAVPKLRGELARIEVRPPRIPVISPVTTKQMDDPRSDLAAALVQPVRWREVLIRLDSLGVKRFVDAGPGKVLKGLVRRTVADAEATTLESREPVHA